jgi:hypothetical protein
MLRLIPRAKENMMYRRWIQILMKQTGEGRGGRGGGGGGGREVVADLVSS